MNVKVLRFSKTKGKTATVAFADVQLGDFLVLRNLSLVKAKDKGKYFVSPPKVKSEKDDKYYDTGFSFCFADGKPTKKSKELQDILVEALVAKLNSSGNDEQDDDGGGW